MLDPKALLLINDHETQIMRVHVRREQPMGSYQYVYRTVRKAFQRLAL